MMKKQFSRYLAPNFTVLCEEDVLMSSNPFNDVIGDDKDWGDLGGFINED